RNSLNEAFSFAIIFFSLNFQLNKIAARWPAKAVAQRFCSIQIYPVCQTGNSLIEIMVYKD
ncbi:hypothetical protein, partial [Hungatella effluvii]|uniref:hypothetical protein n=1 Tax=Hungatella effluvii TaxID=1096246 RepID=UPI002A7F87C4